MSLLCFYYVFTTLKCPVLGRGAKGALPSQQPGPGPSPGGCTFVQLRRVQAARENALRAGRNNYLR